MRIGLLGKGIGQVFMGLGKTKVSVWPSNVSSLNTGCNLGCRVAAECSQLIPVESYFCIERMHIHMTYLRIDIG